MNPKSLAVLSVVTVCLPSSYELFNAVSSSGIPLSLSCYSYSGDPTEALHCFNLARKDKEWFVLYCQCVTCLFIVLFFGSKISFVLIYQACEQNM